MISFILGIIIGYIFRDVIKLFVTAAKREISKQIENMEKK